MLTYDRCPPIGENSPTECLPPGPRPAHEVLNVNQMESPAFRNVIFLSYKPFLTINYIQALAFAQNAFVV